MLLFHYALLGNSFKDLKEDGIEGVSKNAWTSYVKVRNNGVFLNLIYTFTIHKTLIIFHQSIYCTQLCDVLDQKFLQKEFPVPFV